MEAEGKVGSQTLSDGVLSTLALGRYGQAMTTDLLARYYAAAKAGQVFSAGTAATGVSPGTAIGTTSPFTLANPSGSGKDLSVLRVSMGYVSGTLTAGIVHYVANVNPAAAAVTGTACTVVSSYLSTSSPGAKGLAFTTATLPVTPTVLRPFCSILPMLATTVTQPWQVMEEVAGEFVIAPGCSLSLEGTATGGSTPLVCYGITWMETTL